MRITRETSPQYDKKFTLNRILLGNTLSIKRVNENQQVVLMRINKSILLRNENDNRFHSHQSTANLNLRTQSATIPNTLIAKGLYIYKKWKCVEMLTVTRNTLTGLKVFANMGTSTKHMPIEHTQT